MPDPLEDLYKQVILDHYREPRNKGELAVPPAVKAEGYNPLCGDEMTVYLSVDDGHIDDVRIGARGCSISVAAASMMSEAIADKDLAEARKMIDQFRDMMNAHQDDLDANRGIDADTLGSQIGDLDALRGVVRFPVRIKCATLPWVTLAQALTDAEEGRAAEQARRVSTEEHA